MLNLADRDIPLSFDTERLHIRRYQLGDTDTLFEGARESIEHIYPFLPWCHPAYSRDESREWLETIAPEWEKGTSYGFAIFDAADNRFLGGCGVNRMDEHPNVNLGYWVRRSAIGRGIATEATIGLAHFALTTLNMQRVEIIMSVHNEPSRRVAEKAGAHYEGLLRNRLHLHGKNHDAHVYSLIP